MYIVSVLYIRVIISHYFTSLSLYVIIRVLYIIFLTLIIIITIII